MQTLTGFTWPYRGKGAEWEEQREQKIWNDIVMYQLPSIWSNWELCHLSSLRLRAIVPFHSFYSDASCGWQWREPCRQCRSCRLHLGPSPEGLHGANKKQLTQSRPVTISTEKRADISTKLWVGLFVDLLTFELALPGLGCQFRWGNGLLTESTVLQHCTPQNRTCWTPQKKTVKQV